MSITNHNNQARRMWVLLIIGLLTLSSCKLGSTNPAARKTDFLREFSQPIPVSPADVDAAEPAIAASPDGSVYVAWVTHGLEKQADVMIARFNGEGHMQGPAVRVNSQPGIATAWRGDPPTVAVAPDQTLFVGWIGRVESDSPHATNVYLSSSRDRGQTFGAPVKVNDDSKPAVHGMHSLAIGNDGRIYVAWLDERNITPVKDMKMDAKIGRSHGKQS